MTRPTRTYTSTRAVLSECGTYRYLLERRWDAPLFPSKPCLFVMLNPSTADGTEDDPTIRRCVGFARSFGCGSLTVVNLFAYRATKPRDMKAAHEPVGSDNADIITIAALEVARKGGPLVCAWGAHGGFLGQGQAVLRILRKFGTPMCLGATKGGQPKHPLFVDGRTELVPYPPREANP